jgi:hypothetical protein
VQPSSASHENALQSGDPFHPLLQAHVSGLTQVPPFAQPFVQTATSHLDPFHPLSQVQVLGELHLPFPQPPVQIGTSQFSPCQPLAQSHLFGATQLPPIERCATHRPPCH